MTHETRNITRKCRMVSRWPAVTLVSYHIGLPLTFPNCVSTLSDSSLLSYLKMFLNFSNFDISSKENFQKRGDIERNVCRKERFARQREGRLGCEGGERWIKKTGSSLFENVARILMQAVFDSAKQKLRRAKNCQRANPFEPANQSEIFRNEYSRHLALDPILMLDKCCAHERTFRAVIFSS